MSDDVTKDLVFAQPRRPVERHGYQSGLGETEPRDWTVAEVERVMWRVRASGGTDSTPVEFRQGYRGDEKELGMAIRAKHVEAFEYDAPRPRAEVEAGAAAPAPAPQEWWYRPAQAVGLLVALPLVLAALLAAWGVLWAVAT
jgi:hypothetical protein